MTGPLFPLPVPDLTVLVQPVAVVLHADLRRARQDARLPGPAS